MPAPPTTLGKSGLVCLLLLVWVTPCGAAPRLFTLGVTADINAVTVLADGTALLAGSSTTSGRPGVWTITPSSSVTTTLLTGPGGGLRYGVANAISADGTYVAGLLYKTGGALPYQTDGAVWMRAQPSNPTIVPDLSDPFPSTDLRGIANTKVAVGASSQTAYVWDTSAGGAALPTVDASASWANAISAAGTVIVGTALDDESAYPVAVRWTAGQYAALSSDYSAAYAVSPNGQYTAGAVDLVDDEFFELDAVYWDNSQLHLLPDQTTGLAIEGQSTWATDAGIIGGFAGPPGGAAVDAWLYFQGMDGAISFDTWWRQITGYDFPVDVTTIPAAAERDGQLYLALNEGSWFAIIEWAAPGDGNRDRVVDGADYSIWADNFFLSSATTFEQGDYSGDHKVDGADYTIWADNYNPSGLSFALALPEPSTWALILIGGSQLLLPAVRRRASGVRD